MRDGVTLFEALAGTGALGLCALFTLFALYAVVQLVRESHGHRKYGSEIAFLIASLALDAAFIALLWIGYCLT